MCFVHVKLMVIMCALEKCQIWQRYKILIIYIRKKPYLEMRMSAVSIGCMCMWEKAAIKLVNYVSGQ